jgi:hypothetical protein
MGRYRHFHTYIHLCLHAKVNAHGNCHCYYGAFPNAHTLRGCYARLGEGWRRDGLRAGRRVLDGQHG